MRRDEGRPLTREDRFERAVLIAALTLVALAVLGVVLLVVYFAFLHPELTHPGT